MTHTEDELDEIYGNSHPDCEVCQGELCLNDCCGFACSATSNPIHIEGMWVCPGECAGKMLHASLVVDGQFHSEVR